MTSDLYLRYAPTHTNSPAKLQEWLEYARVNNAQAEEFVKQNPAGDDHVYVLTTCSWRELGHIKKLKKKT
jgi:hypothetical protein